MASPRNAILTRPFDQMVRDQFAAALELGFAQTHIDALPPGHISLEEKERGGLYAKWRRQGADGKPASPLYLGPAHGPEHQQAQAQLEELARIERHAKNLRKLGLSTEDQGSALVLAALVNAGFFRAGGVLVGTRAFRCIANHLGYQVAAIATQDVDIARPHTLHLAQHLRTEGLLSLLKQTGLRFIEVPGFKRSEPSSSWRVIGKEIKLDLLVPAKGKHKAYSTVAVPELGAHATALEYLDYLMEESMEALVIGKSQLIPVRVPAAARFVWHKRAIARLRPATLNTKSAKDIAQAEALTACLVAEGREDELEAARAAMPASMRRLT